MYPVTVVNMNYAGPITLGVLLIALVNYFTTGKKRFNTFHSKDSNSTEVFGELDGEGK